MHCRTAWRDRNTDHGVIDPLRHTIHAICHCAPPWIVHVAGDEYAWCRCGDLIPAPPVTVDSNIHVRAGHPTCDPAPTARDSCDGHSYYTDTGGGLVARSESACDPSPLYPAPPLAPRGIRAAPESTYNRAAIPRVLPGWLHNKRERHRVVRCQVGSHFDVRVAEQTAHPKCVRAGGRVVPQIAVLKSVNRRI
jgi:hypothetical protein